MSTDRRDNEYRNGGADQSASQQPDVTETVSRPPDLRRWREAMPKSVGPYKILETLGEGGMGTVYLAEQTKPIRRRVALKIIKLGMDTKQVIARFETERQALAVMDHPGVAKVFDAGTTDEGRPYFAMEHVPGVSITDYCDRHRLPTVERLHLFMQVCQAVQHAHQKGIIHRDIKPSNVLVAVEDGKPVPKVIDFGVAKATEHRLTEKTFFTEQGQLIGTPEYMSPEQAEMTALDIDTRTDIYSLGVLLYELLVGALPFDPRSLRRAALAEIQRIIREEEPPKPSTRLSSLATAQPVGSAVRTTETEPQRVGSAVRTTEESEPGAQATGLSTPRSRSGLGSAADIARHRRTDLTALIKQLRGDLDWIIMRAMDKDRTRRYATATAFAEDIGRHLNHEPVHAGPPHATYRLKKFLRRNKAPVAAVLAIFVVLSAGVATATHLYLRAECERERAVRAEEQQSRERERAEEARDDSDAVVKFLSDMLAAVRPGKQGKDVSVREVLDKAAKTIGEKFHDKPLIEARLRGTIGGSYRALGLYDAAEPHAAAAARIFRRELGPRHRDTLAAMTNLGVTLRRQGKFSAAAASLRKTYEIARRVLGEEHAETLRSMIGLANALSDQGKYAEAEALHRQTLKIKRRVLGEEHPRTLNSMSGLGAALDDQGRYAEAETVYWKTLEIQRRVLGEEHPDTLGSMNNLAGAFAGQGKYAEAEKLYRQTLEIKRRVLGDEHPTTVLSMGNLGIALDAQGKCAEAEKLYRKTLEIKRRVLGEEHPSTLLSMGNLGIALRAQGKYAEAEKLNRETLEILRRVLGEEHHLTLVSMSNLAQTLGDLGRLPEAETLFRQTVETMRRVLGNEHPWLSESLVGLGEVLLKKGEPEDAQPPLHEALKIQQAALPSDHWHIANTQSVLGECLTALARYDEAEPLVLKSYDRLEAVQGESGHEAIKALKRIIKLYAAWDAAEPGKGYAEKAAEWRRRLPVSQPGPNPDAEATREPPDGRGP